MRKHVSLIILPVCDLQKLRQISESHLVINILIRMLYPVPIFRSVAFPKAIVLAIKLRIDVIRSL